MMNEEMSNEMQQTVAPVAQEQQVMVAQQATPVIPEAKKGMTTGQKLAGAGLIAFAIAGIVWVVKSVISGIKKVISAFKKPQEAPVQQAAAPAPAPAVTQEPVAPAAPQQTVQTQAATPEQK